MATLKQRALRDGTLVHDVRWRLGGGRSGAQKCETFNPKDGPHRDLGHAERFKEAVESAGHQWPANYLPGIGWVSPEVLAVHEARRAEQAAAKPAAQPLLLAEYAETWLESRSGIQDRTVRRYRQILEQHVLPFFPGVAIDDTQALGRNAIGRWINALEKGERDEEGEDDDTAWLRPPLSAKSIHNIHGVLSSLMKSAVRQEPPLRASNPCEGSDLPSVDEGLSDEEMVFLTPEQFDVLLAEMADDAKAFTEFLVGTGMRFSEATALRREDFHLDDRKPYVEVRRAWKQKANGAYVLGAPKTKAGRRRVSLTPAQVGMLRPLLAGLGAKDLAFRGPNGGRWTHSTYYTQRWRHALYRAARCVECRGRDYAAGIGRRGFRDLTSEHIVWCGHEGQLDVIPRVHDLRHTHVAWLISTRAQVLAIARRVGHASTKITQDRYGHLLPEVDDELVAGLGEVMGRVTGSSVAAGARLRELAAVEVG